MNTIFVTFSQWLDSVSHNFSMVDFIFFGLLILAITLLISWVVSANKLKQDHKILEHKDLESKDEKLDDDYGDNVEEFGETSFWKKIGRYAVVAGKSLIEKALILYYCLLDSETPPGAKIIIAAALGYFISPVDFIPDVTPIIGYGDDFSELAVAFKTVIAYIKSEHTAKAQEKIKTWFS